MEESTPAQTNPEPVNKGCINCNHPIVEEGYPNRLCSDCRQNFIKFPIPLWIKIFGGVVFAVLLYSMSKLPQTISAGVEFAKGKKAIDEKNYITAQKAFEKVTVKEPKYIEGLSYLMIASFNNQDFETFINTFNSLKSKEINDTELFNKLDHMIAIVGNYFPSDSLSALSVTYKNSIDSIPDNILLAYLKKNPDDIYAKTSFASRLFDKKSYLSVDSFLSSILSKEPGMFNVILMKASVKRELKQWDSSFYFCDFLINGNKQSVYGLSSKARTFLKNKQDKQGLDFALKAYNLNSNEPYALATLAMAYHLNNMKNERDVLIKIADSDSLKSEYMSYVTDIISGKEKFRD